MSAKRAGDKRYVIHVADVFTDLEFAADGELPSSIQVGGSVVPTLTGELAGGW